MYQSNFWVLPTALDILVHQSIKRSFLDYLCSTMHIVGKDVYYDKDSRFISLKSLWKEKNIALFAYL